MKLKKSEFEEDEIVMEEQSLLQNRVHASQGRSTVETDETLILFPNEAVVRVPRFPGQRSEKERWKQFEGNNYVYCETGSLSDDCATLLSEEGNS